MKYTNLFFLLIFSLLSGITMQDFTKRIALCSYKKFSQIKDYGKKLKTDMRDFKCNVSGIKKFALAHPFISAKISYDIISSSAFIFAPIVLSSVASTKMQKIGHYSLFLFFNSYKNLFKDIFSFKQEYFDFAGSSFQEGFWFSHNLQKYALFPFLGLFFDVYQLSRNRLAFQESIIGAFDITKNKHEEREKFFADLLIKFNENTDKVNKINAIKNKLKNIITLTKELQDTLNSGQIIAYNKLCEYKTIRAEYQKEYNALYEAENKES